jgi:hypothetical protein
MLKLRMKNSDSRFGGVVACALFFRFVSPMNENGGTVTMQITITISDAIVREAGTRGLPVIDFVESLIDKGLVEQKERPVLNSAM